jgi:hypothetical protein
MRVKTTAPTVLIATVILVVCTCGVIGHQLSAGLIDSVEESRFELMRSILASTLAETESKALARAELVASLPSIAARVRAADRAGLQAETATLFAQQRDRFGLSQAQFFVPPTTSFLRLNLPEKFGDDVSSFRPMVVEWSKTQQSLQGVSISRSGPAVFGIASVKDAQGLVGGFEIGLDLGPVLDGLKSKHGFEAAIFVDEKPLREVATALGGDVLSEENRVGKTIRFYTTHLDRLRELVQDRDISLGEERTYVRDAGGVPYGVFVTPLKNYAGRTLGMVALAADFSGTRASAGRTLVWQILLTLVGCIVCAALILIVLRGMVQVPLREVGSKFAALAAGDREARIEGADEMPDELQELAKAHEALRGKEAES